MGASPVFISNIRNTGAQIQNSDGTNLVTLVTPGSTGSRVYAISATSDDSSARVLQLWVTIGATDYLLGELSVPAGSGSDGSNAALNLLDPASLPFLLSDGTQTFLELASGSVLKVKSKTAVTSGKKLQFMTQHGDI